MRKFSHGGDKIPFDHTSSEGDDAGIWKRLAEVLPYFGVAGLTLASSYFFYPSLLINLTPLLLMWGWSWRIPAHGFIGLPLIPLLCVNGGGPLYFLFISALLIFSTYPILTMVFLGNRGCLVRVREIGDGWWVLAAGVGFSCTVFFNTLRLHYNFQTGIWDLGVYDNIFNNIILGNGQATPAQRCNPDVSHLNIHKSYFYYILAPLYALYPKAVTLLFFNASAVTASGMALFFLAKGAGLDRFSVLAISLIWIFYPPIQGAAFFQFHESSFAPIFLFLCGWTMISGRRLWAFIFFALTLSVKEDYAFVWGPLFLLFGWWGGRRMEGIVMATVCALYVVFFYALPHPHDENFGVLFSNTGEYSATGVLSLVIRNPSALLEALWQPKNLQGAVELLLPVALLPLHTVAGIFALFLPAGLCYIPGNDSLALNRLQYSYTLAAPVFLGALYALTRMKAPRRKVWVGMAVVGTVTSQFVWGIANPQNTIKSGGDYFKVPHLETDGRQRWEELVELTKDIPPDAAVMASNTILPHFSSRALAYGYEVCQMDREGYYQGNVRNLKWEQLDHRRQPHYVVVWKPAGFMPDNYRKHAESLHFEVWTDGRIKTQGEKKQ